MKIICVVLSIVLVVLGAHYAVLHMDHQTLRQQLTRQQADFDVRLRQERDTYQKKIDSLQDFIAFGQNNRLPAPVASAISQSTSNEDKANDFVAMQQANLQRTLEKKYSLLMSRLGLSGTSETELQRLLEQREKILNASSIGYYASQAEIEQAVNQQQQGLAEIDRQIAQLLASPEDRKTYELLKDSAYEQYQMNNFFDQSQGDSPIPVDKREALLISKLERKQEFNRHMEATAAAIQNASAEEKQYLIKEAQEALYDYRDNFLESAQPNLTPEQYDALRAREKQQFAEMWESLQAGWETQ